MNNMTLKRLAKLSGAGLITVSLTWSSSSAQSDNGVSDGINSTLANEGAQVWTLEGGGEVIGKLVKETSLNTYVDLGPKIIELPRNSIQERRPLKEMEEEARRAANEAANRPNYDPAEGKITFRERTDFSQALSQQEILEKVKKSVVLVSNPGGLGTGWIIDEQGRVVTNHHVVGNELYQDVTIFKKDGDQWEKIKISDCEVEAFSSLLDIAIVRLDLEQVEENDIDLTTIQIAAPTSLEAGDPVYAVGNPGMGSFVLDHTISEGIVSSLARNFNDVLYLQTTAAVNPGNSGGPLVNERGEVVGLVTLKAIFQEGVAFALPVDYILHFLRNSTAFAISEANKNKGYRYHHPN